jgi:hypothetical protein
MSAMMSSRRACCATAPAPKPRRALVAVRFTSDKAAPVAKTAPKPARERLARFGPRQLWPGA